MSGWDEAKLDALLPGMERSVREFCSEPETRASGEILGYWFYQLENCRTERLVPSIAEMSGMLSDVYEGASLKEHMDELRGPQD